MLIDSGDGMNIRGTFIVDGIVQGVSYREIVLRAARELRLTGYVRNLKDGTVRIEAEGEKETIRRFLERINIQTGRIMVDVIKERYFEATGHFRPFRIERGKNISDGDLELIEKMDMGYHMMEEMNAGLSGRLDGTNMAVKEVGANIKTMDGHLTHMDSNMGTRFDRLDKKYVEFGKTMKSVRKDTKTMASDIKVIRKEATIGRKKPATG
jgi:acylphosphatase